MKKINNAMDYIEENLAEGLDYNIVAQKACCSVDHFQRMFSYIADMPLSEYIRRRKLTLAAFELRDSSMKIVDLAAKYGYKSPEAFSRAFKNLHGVMPMSVRNTETVIKAYPRIMFGLSMEGDVPINYRIVDKQPYEVCGIKTEITSGSELTNTLITQFWEENIRNGVIGKFHRDIGLEYDVCMNAALFDYQQNRFSYMICYEVPLGGSTGYFTLHVPAYTWAVFFTPEHEGEENTQMIRSIRRRIFLEWFPTTGYVHAGGPEFEIFKRSRKGEKFIIEIWIPIKKRG